MTATADLPDAILVLRSQLGDRAALSTLVARWHEPLWRFLVQLTLDEAAADELVQETWLAALRNLAGLRDPEALRPWLYTIARRAATDRLRRRYRRPEVTTAIDELPARAADGPADEVVDRRYVAALLAHLDLDLRTPVALHYLHDCPIDEIAQIMEIPAGTVKSRLHRARNRLQTHGTAPSTTHPEDSPCT